MSMSFYITVRALVCFECHSKSAGARCPHAVCLRTMSARQKSIPQKHTTDQTGWTFVSDASGHLWARSQTQTCYVLHQLPSHTPGPMVAVVQQTCFSLGLQAPRPPPREAIFCGLAFAAAPLRAGLGWCEPDLTPNCFFVFVSAILAR